VAPVQCVVLVAQVVVVGGGGCCLLVGVSVIREIQSWPQLQSQSHVTAKLRHAYYLMSSEREYSVRKLSSSINYQMMLMSCVQKNAKYKGKMHEYLPLETKQMKGQYGTQKRGVHRGAQTDTLCKKIGRSTIKL